MKANELITSWFLMLLYIYKV